MTRNDGAVGEAPDFGSAEIALPAVMTANEKRVRGGFWRKLARVFGTIPFAEEAVAAYYCAFDPATPTRVRAILLAALAYFVVPFDVLPDFIMGLGFTDDATVLMTALGLIHAHMTPAHRARARETLDRMSEGERPDGAETGEPA